jgi:hypothetical protein
LIEIVQYLALTIHELGDSPPPDGCHSFSLSKTAHRRSTGYLGLGSQSQINLPVEDTATHSFNKTACRQSTEKTGYLGLGSQSQVNLPVEDNNPRGIKLAV